MNNDKINQLKCCLGSIEVLVEQQPFLYLFLKPTIKYLRARIKFEKIILTNNKTNTNERI